MSYAPVVAALAFQTAAAAVPHGAEDAHGHYAPPHPDKLGGPFAFTDTRGALVRSDDLKGRWTLLYFGYARCTASCTTAIPMLAEAGRELRRRGVAVTAAFVDIDAPAGAVLRKRTGGPVHEGHGSPELKALAGKFDGDLLVLTGDRRQLAAAAIAFQVNREHTPPRDGETGHSLNHSSLVYLIAPDGRVAGYADSDVTPQQLANSVQSLIGG